MTWGNVRTSGRRDTEFVIKVHHKFVDANQKLVEIFEKKIQDTLTEIWGEENDHEEAPEE